MHELNEKRVIKLPMGGELEVQTSPEFLLRVAGQMGISPDDVTDDHVRMFVWGAMKTAIDKAEREGHVEEAGQPT